LRQADVAVVGAGPAGLAATIVLAEAGADVLLVDEQPAEGGQIYRQPPPGFTPRDAAGRPYRQGHALLARVAAADRIDRRLGTIAWGIFAAHAVDAYGQADEATAAGVDRDRRVVALAGPHGIERVSVRRILLATGAYDLPVAFPGWTLPGVIGAGGVQAFVKSQHLLPGRRFLLAGGHPLLLVIAEQLLGAGADLAGVALAQPRPRLAEAFRAAPRLRGHVRKLGDIARPLARLRRAGVRVDFSRLIVAAHGHDAVRSATLADVDRRWRRVAGSEVVVECDTVALGYGFVPSSELARQAGCVHRFDPGAGGWRTAHDRWMRASEEAIYVAGEITGVAGAEEAIEEGRLAALAILRDLGHVSGPHAERLAAPVRRRLRHIRRFSALVQDQFAPRYEALAALATDDTIVCRCEEVSAARVRAALRAHPHVATADAVKLLTRVGMGACQGRLCELTVTHLVAAERGRDPAAIGPYAARPPAKPIPLGALADQFTTGPHGPSAAA
jgi:NADPH-dependent 2,4-dienoyl-CoA reductase/sulfur reductase-like enzyme